MHHLYFYVPKSHLEGVKEALFAIGAGAIGDYERCCWQTLGEGQFCPKAGANPHTGKVNKLEHVPEYKVELVFEDHLLEKVIATLKVAHPYEEVAFGVFKLM